MQLLIGNCARAPNWEIHGVERRGKESFLFQFIYFRLFCFGYHNS